MKRLSGRSLRNLFAAGFVFVGALLFLLFHSESTKPALPALHINEICAKNPGFYLENTLISSDYIELYNSGKTPISLDGLYLSDDSLKPQKCRLTSNIEIAPGAYCLVYATHDPDSLPDGSVSVDFQLKAGETIILSSEEHILDMVEIPDSSSGISYSRTADGISEFEELWFSPGVSNQNAARPLEAVTFSLESGFYDEPVFVEISSVSDTPIYYTLDGSLPTAESLLYQDPLILSDASVHENTFSLREDISTLEYPYSPPKESVDKAVIIRAAAIDDEGNYSPTATSVYFIGFQDKKGYENVPILSLVTEPESLFDSDKGIYIRGSLYEEGLANGEISPDLPWASFLDYANYYMRGSSSERNAHFTCFSSSGELLFDLDGGFRIRGNQLRSYPQKSFSLFSRSRYGTGFFCLPFFEKADDITSITLNASHSLAKTFINSLVSDRNISTQQSNACQVFLNGEYWGLYDFMEKYNDSYIFSHYGITSDNLLMIESTYSVAEGNPEDLESYRELRHLFPTDLSSPLQYQLLQNQMDMQNLIDWLCTNIYIANTDTQAFGSNVFTWQSRYPGDLPYEDRRWRWMLYDTDNAFAAGMDIDDSHPAWAVDSFVEHPGYTSSAFLYDEPLVSLMSNENFRRTFVLTFLDMANQNFRFETVSDMLDTILEERTSWAAKSFERWDGSHIYDPSAFQAEVAAMREFFQNRFDSIVPCMAEHFSLTGTLAPLTLSANDPAAGSIQLNTIVPSIEKEPWTGYYYTDYPITLTAHPLEGYAFTGWEISGASIIEGTEKFPSISLKLGSDNIQVTACFEKAD